MLLFLTFSVLVANPERVLCTVANPARGLLNGEMRVFSITVGFSPTFYCWPKVVTTIGEPVKKPCRGFVFTAYDPT